MAVILWLMVIKLAVSRNSTNLLTLTINSTFISRIYQYMIINFDAATAPTYRFFAREQAAREGQQSRELLLAQFHAEKSMLTQQMEAFGRGRGCCCWHCGTPGLSRGVPYQGVDFCLVFNKELSLLIGTRWIQAVWWVFPRRTGRIKHWTPHTFDHQLIVSQSSG